MQIWFVHVVVVIKTKLRDRNVQIQYIFTLLMLIKSIYVCNNIMNVLKPVMLYDELVPENETILLTLFLVMLSCCIYKQ